MANDPSFRWMRSLLAFAVENQFSNNQSQSQAFLNIKQSLTAMRRTPMMVRFGHVGIRLANNPIENQILDARFDGNLRKFIKSAYKMFCSVRFSYIRDGMIKNNNLFLKADVYDLIPIHRISPPKDMFFLPIDHILVTTGIRRITIAFVCQNKSYAINYDWQATAGIIFYGKEEPTIFQVGRCAVIAADDFFFLVRNPNNRILSLKFDIHKIQPGDPWAWPDDTFYKRVEANLKTLSYKIKVRAFEMKYFDKFHWESDETPPIPSTVWPFLEPNCLNEVILRIWSDALVPSLNEPERPSDKRRLGRIPETLQWRNAKLLDIHDDIYKIEIADIHYVTLGTFTKVRIKLFEEDAVKLLTGINSIVTPFQPLTKFMIIVPNEFIISPTQRATLVTSGIISSIHQNDVMRLNNGFCFRHRVNDPTFGSFILFEKSQFTEAQFPHPAAVRNA